MLPVHEDDVIEPVDRLEAEKERRVAVLFKHDGGEQRGLETMRGPLADDAAETALRGASARFLVVGKMIEIPLHCERRPQPRNEPALAESEARSSQP
jgi:hypothetical protein